jgi:hypothetical protein
VPVGYLVSVALVTLFALVPLRAVGNLSFRLGLLLNEVPILGFSWLVADTSLAFAEGDISSAGGWATVGLAALTTAGLAVIAWRGLRARPVLEQAMAEALGPTGVRPSTPGWPRGCAAGCRSPASCFCRCRAAGGASSGWPTSATATPAAATSSTSTVPVPVHRAARS